MGHPGRDTLVHRWTGSFFVLLELPDFGCVILFAIFRTDCYSLPCNWLDSVLGGAELEASSPSSLNCWLPCELIPECLNSPAARPEVLREAGCKLPADGRLDWFGEAGSALIGVKWFMMNGTKTKKSKEVGFGNQVIGVSGELWRACAEMQF